MPQVFFIPGEIFLEFRWDRKSVKVKNGTKMDDSFCRGCCLVEKALPFHSQFCRHQQTEKHLVINSCSAAPWEQKLWETLLQNRAKLFLHILFCLLFVLKIAVSQLESYQCHGTCNLILDGHLFYVLPEDGSLLQQHVTSHPLLGWFWDTHIGISAQIACYLLYQCMKNVATGNLWKY